MTAWYDAWYWLLLAGMCPLWIYKATSVHNRRTKDRNGAKIRCTNRIHEEMTIVWCMVMTPTTDDDDDDDDNDDGRRKRKRVFICVGRDERWGTDESEKYRVSYDTWYGVVRMVYCIWYTISLWCHTAHFVVYCTFLVFVFLFVVDCVSKDMVMVPYTIPYKSLLWYESAPFVYIR